MLSLRSHGGTWFVRATELEEQSALVLTQVADSPRSTALL